MQASPARNIGVRSTLHRRRSAITERPTDPRRPSVGLPSSMVSNESWPPVRNCRSALAVVRTETRIVQDHATARDVPERLVLKLTEVVYIRCLFCEGYPMDE